MISTDGVIVELGQRIRRMYIARVRMRGGRWAHYEPSAGPNLWFGVASLCAAHGLDPELHVNALVDGDLEPYPNKLLGVKAVERTRRHARVQCRVDCVGEHVESQLAKLRGRVACGTDLRSVLTSPLEDLTYAFRYAVAVSSGMNDVACLMRPFAQLDLAARPEMRARLATLLPPGVVDGVLCVDVGTNQAVGDSSRS